MRRYLTYREHGLLIACRDYVHDALVAAMEDRGSDLAWIDSERLTVAVAANQWAAAHGYERRVTVDDVERVEVQAVGHVDYASKLALYVAEFVAEVGDVPTEEEDQQ